MQNVLIVTDINKDPDDLLMLIMAAALHKRGKINLLGVITTSGCDSVTLNRAKYARGILNALDADIPVCAGSGKQYESVEATTSMNMFVDTQEVRGFVKEGSRVEVKPLEFLRRCLEQVDDKTLSLLCVAGMTDVARLMIAERQLFLDKIEKIAVMGGVTFDDKDKVGLSNAYNNLCDFSAAELVKGFSIDNNIRTLVVDREAARKVSVDIEFYRTLLAGGHPVGVHAYNVQSEAFKEMINGIQNGTNLKRHTMEWFFEKFTTITLSDYDKFRNADPALIVNMVDRQNLYDPLTLMALVESEFKDMFAIDKHNNILLPVPKQIREIYGAFYDLISEYLKNMQEQKSAS